MGKSFKFKNSNEYWYPYPYLPIGSIYLSINDINPASYFGGTWEMVAEGKTLVGVDENDSDFDSAGKTGGEKNHTLTVSELPYIQPRFYKTGGSSSRFQVSMNWSHEMEEVASQNAVVGTIGGDQPHNNMPPYFACYIWLRTA